MLILLIIQMMSYKAEQALNDLGPVGPPPSWWMPWRGSSARWWTLSSSIHHPVGLLSFAGLQPHVSVILKLCWLQLEMCEEVSSTKRLKTSIRLLGCQRAAKHISRINTKKQGGSAWFCSFGPNIEILSDFHETFCTNARTRIRKTNWREHNDFNKVN